MKTFTLYWLDGTHNTITGETISEAFSLAGYGRGAVGALDFYDNGLKKYSWDSDLKKWKEDKNEKL